MTHCLVCNQEIEVSREAISAHADWHVNQALEFWFALWPLVIAQDEVAWAVDENWLW